MHPYTTDTFPGTGTVQIERIRNIALRQRAWMNICMSSRLDSEYKNAIRRVNPEFSEQEVDLAFIQLNCGQNLADQVRSHLMGRTGEQ